MSRNYANDDAFIQKLKELTPEKIEKAMADCPCTNQGSCPYHDQARAVLAEKAKADTFAALAEHWLAAVGMEGGG